MFEVRHLRHRTVPLLDGALRRLQMHDGDFINMMVKRRSMNSHSWRLKRPAPCSESTT